MSKRLSGLLALPIVALLIGLLAACSNKDEMRLPSEARAYVLKQLKDNDNPTVKESYMALDSVHIASTSTPSEVYGAINEITYNLHHNGQRSLALSIHRGLLDMLESDDNRTLVDDKEMLMVLVRMGATYSEAGMYGIALGYYSKGLEFCKNKPEYDNYEALFYNYIGVLYAGAELYDKSLEYFQKSLDINRRLGVNKDIFLNYYYFTEVYIDKENLQDAKASLQRSLPYLDSIHVPVYDAYVDIQEGKIDSRLGMYAESGKKLDEAMLTFEKYDDTSGIIATYLSKGNLYLEQNKPDSVILFANVAKNLSKSASQGETLVSAYNLLARAYIEKGEKDKAIHALERQVSMKDSLLHLERRIRLENWETLGVKSFPGSAHMPSESNAAIYMTVAFVLLGLMTALTYYNLHHRTQVPTNTNHAGPEEERRD